MKKILLICTLCVIILQLEAQDSKQTKISLNIALKGDSVYEFEIINNSEDTIYLFDSYIKDLFYHSKYIHRYDRKSKQCRLSFLPLLPFLTAKLQIHTFISGDNKIVKYGQVFYQFDTIPSKCSIKVKIPKSAFYTKQFVKEIYPQKLSKFFMYTKKIHDVKQNKCEILHVEFAIYKKINLLTCNDTFHLNEYNYNDQASSFDILSIPVILDSQHKKK